jgi:hypothetical protein
MGRFVEGEDRRQGVLLPEYLDAYMSEDNPVRVIDVFVDELALGALGFSGVVPEATGRPIVGGQSKPEWTGLIGVRDIRKWSVDVILQIKQ